MAAPNRAFASGNRNPALLNGVPYPRTVTEAGRMWQNSDRVDKSIDLQLHAFLNSGLQVGREAVFLADRQPRFRN